MSIECKDILQLSKLKELKIAGGASGLGRSIRWIYIAEVIEDINDIANWIFGNELVIITGHGLKGDTQALLELIYKLNEKNISGIIINVGLYIQKIPPEIIDLADRLSLPVFELPWEVKLVDITQDICSAIVTKELEEKTQENLLENILFSRVSLENNFIKLAVHYGFDLEDICVIGIMDIDDFAEFLSTRRITDEKKIMEIKAVFQRTIQEVFSRYSINILTMSKSDSVIFLIKYNAYVKNSLTRILDEIRNEVNARFNDIKISAGIGKSYSNLNDLRLSYNQAEQALKASRCEFTGNSTCFYEHLGIYLLLLKIDDKQFLNKFYNDLFMSIIEYDKNTNSKLLETFETFLNENCMMDKTAKRLFIHKNTLKYRLEKIEKLLNCNLDDLQQIIKYEIGFKVGKFMHM